MKCLFFSLWKCFRGARPISGKLIRNRAFGRKIIYNEFRGVTQTDFWITHPNRSVSRPRKLKFRKNFWMSFPGFAIATPEPVLEQG